ncbi:MAG: AAA family ATPase [bacterium]|nr:AAA family ATPase [bacterium]
MTSSPLCRVELFGGLRLITPTQTIAHFRTQKTALLFAYLAVNLHQTHPREMLIDLLWEESDIDAGRTSLRVALSAIRKQLEQAGVPPDEVLYSDQFGIGLRSYTVITDLREMEQYIRLARHAPSESESLACLSRAVDLCTDVPLKGFYEEWVLQLQQQTAERYFRALDELIRLLENAGDRAAALEYALRGSAYDPLREEPRAALMRLYVAMGYPAEAKRVYRQWEDLVREELGATPSRAMQQLSQRAEAHIQEKHESSQRLCDSSLPSIPARLFGREREISLLMDLLSANAACLITLTGHGGIGKTSLAIEVARRLVGRGLPAWFVDAADVRGGRALLERILRTVGVAPHAERSVDTVAQVVGGSAALLILDNFEQVDDAAAGVVSELLQRLPALRVIITSRRKTGLPNERVIRLRPLETLPTSAWQEEGDNSLEESALEAIGQCPSIQLFMEHARRGQPGFHLTPENAPVVMEICEYLEGLPLAIVLAASRTRVLSPSQILHAVQQQIGVLSQPQALVPERHRSLHASLEWSYTLLSPELRKSFAMLSVFSGGWNLAAALCVLTGAAPCDDHTLDVTVLDTLDALVECSLVQMEERDGEARYRMLGVVRRYALEKLRSEHDANDAFARHFLFYSSLASRADQNRTGPQAARWASQVALEHQNMMGAIEYMLARDTSRSNPAALQVAADLWVFWMMRGILTEGRALLDRLITHYRDSTDEEVSHWWAWVAMGAGALAWMQRDLSRAEEILHQSLQRFEQEGDTEGQAFAIIWLGNVFYRMGDYERAEDAYVRSMAIAEESGTTEAQIYAAMWIGNLAQRTEDLKRARAMYDHCLHLASERHDLYALGFAHYNLAQVALRERDYAECVLQLFHCLQIRAQIQDQPGFLEAVESLVVLCAHRGEHVAGARLMGACGSWRRKLHMPSSPPQLGEAQHILRHRMGDEAYLHHVEQGRSLSVQETLQLAETLALAPERAGW